MNLKQIQKLLIDLKSKDFVASRRKGPTGIGHTLEQELNLKENNISIPDLGGRVELKATRKNTNTLITLFTFNKGAWLISQREFIENYGYYDNKIGRKAFYNMVKVNETNTQGLTLKVNRSKQTINLLHSDSKKVLAKWSVYTIVGKFMNKLERLLFVIAESKIIDNKEYFHFNSAVILTNPTPEKFLNSFNKGFICIDLRMHLRSNNSVRNHGTGFRVIEDKLPILFGTIKQLI
ncbi:MAG: MvaI/BcnI family restriction endonuclease [Ignavibacteria bacterium]|jgi:hypothetical protein